MRHPNGTSTMHEIGGRYEFEGVLTKHQLRLTMKGYRYQYIDVSERTTDELVGHRTPMSQVVKKTSQCTRIGPSEIGAMMLVNPLVWVCRLRTRCACFKTYCPLYNYWKILLNLEQSHLSSDTLLFVLGFHRSGFRCGAFTPLFPQNCLFIEHDAAVTRRFSTSIAG
jgi:hypothetical protein